MSKHWDKGIARAQETVRMIGRAEPRTEPRTRQEIESFIRGFGVTGPSVARIVEEWAADQQRARDAGWESHAESVWYDEG